MRSADFTKREMAIFLAGLVVGSVIEAGIWVAWMVTR